MNTLLLLGKRSGLSRRLCATVFLTLAVFSGLVEAQVPQRSLVSVGSPLTREIDILPGQTTAEVTVPVSGARRLQLQVIAPVPNPQFSLFDPSGSPLSLSNATRLDGSASSPALPGAALHTPWFTAPRSGEWRLRVNFAPAQVRTVLLVTALVESSYRASVILGGIEFRQDDAAAASLFVLADGAPVTGAAVTLTAQAPSGRIIDLLPNDAGTPNSADAAANDGMYSGALVFDEVGRYVLRGTARFNDGSGAQIIREAMAVAFVSAPKLDLTGISTGVLNGTNSCISAVTVNLNTSLRVPGQVVASAVLRASNGKRMQRNLSVAAAAGPLPLSLQFSSADLRNELGVNGPYTVERVQVVVTSADGTTLEGSATDAAVTASIALTSLCVDPVRVGSVATVVPVITNGYISALNVSFPVSVSSAGLYRISFRVTGGERQQVAASSQSPTLPAGSSTVTVVVPATALQSVDGPFQVESVLVLGPAGSANVALVPSNTSFSRWQFTPTFRGDLNADGRVDVLDRDILATFRNVRSLQPGDRRDLDRNGIIDLRDVQLLQRGYCAPGSCVP